MSTDKTERAAFEATIGAGRVLARATNGDYVSPYVQDDWYVWQVAVKEIQRAACNFCLAEAAKALPSQPATVVQPVDETWAKYIAGLIETYLNFGRDPLKREEAIAGIIARRMQFIVHPSAPAESGWQPIASAPDGVRVLLGPREAPVVGIVRQMPEWADEQEPVASVIHYNGTVLVAGYHCSEWHALPAAPSAAQPGGADGGAS